MFGCQLSNDVALLDDVSLPGDVFGVVASTTRRDICRPTGGQERVEIKYSIHPIITMPTITMMLLVSMERGESGRISWTGKIVDKDVKFWLVSSFAVAEKAI